jgi:hypothetical protein
MEDKKQIFLTVETIQIIVRLILLSIIIVIYIYYEYNNLLYVGNNNNRIIERINYQTGILNSYSLYLKYEKLINYTKYLNITNLIVTNVENYGDIDIDYKIPNIYLIKINNLVSFDIIYNIVKDLSVKYSRTGYCNFPDGEIIYSDYINNINMHMDKYIFDTTINTKLENIQMIYDIIPLPKNSPINNSIALYSGQAYTGTYFHVHENLYSYLMKGKKIWMVMNDINDFNNDSNLLNNTLNPINWYINNINNYSKNPNISIFIQNEGEVVFIPNGKYHFELNLEPSYGFFYESQEFKNNSYSFPRL